MITKLNMFLYYLGAGMGKGYDLIDVESTEPLIIVMQNKRSGEVHSFNYTEEFNMMQYTGD
jgi:hypothetical protein